MKGIIDKEAIKVRSYRADDCPDVYRVIFTGCLKLIIFPQHILAKFEQEHQKNATSNMTGHKFAEVKLSRGSLVFLCVMHYRQETSLKMILSACDLLILL